MTTSGARPADVALPARRSLTEDVYQALMSQLMDQVIEPGSPVIIDELARRLKVSPTPVREALARLESDGLVHREQHRGYFSSPALSDEGVDDLFQFRLLLEPWNAAQAAKRCDREAAGTLVAELAEFPSTAEGLTYSTYQQLLEHDARFHRQIAEIAGNDHVITALARTHAHMHLFRLRDRASGVAETLVEHRAIAEAITAGDARTARTAMTNHLRSARRRFPGQGPSTQEQ